ncbi:hypothetical protein RHGRI_013637 [Rhododendron griersonianum]|uniref:DNA topoisomerase (ATP-hydrolyzing) n=1 Tax=Rhododendron griersonianum TaxID=479676 RepID=A0AAV6K6V5_9ERIC|nr:hypothetical protein RHGRI_013637 [Rhododendron griersonianum]
MQASEDVLRHRDRRLSHGCSYSLFPIRKFIPAGEEDNRGKKTTGGRNGYGAKLTNIFSTELVVETADGEREKKYKQVTCVKEDEGWTLIVLNGTHDHPCALQEEGHPYKRRLSSKHIKMMVQMSSEMLKPKEILRTVNQMDDCKMVTIKSVYNARYKHKNKLPQQEPKNDLPMKDATNTDVDFFVTKFSVYDVHIQQQIFERLKAQVIGNATKSDKGEEKGKHFSLKVPQPKVTEVAVKIDKGKGLVAEKCPTSPYVKWFPIYIEEIIDVKGDGNCGY